MPLSPKKQFAQLDAAQPEDLAIAAEVAESVNRKIGSITGEVQARLQSLFGGSNLRTTGPEAIADLRTIEAKLTNETEVKTLFATTEAQKEYRDRFAEILDTRFGPVSVGAPPVQHAFDFSRTKDAIRTTINRLIGSAQPQELPADRARAQEEQRDQERETDDNAHKGEDRAPLGGFRRKVGRTAGVAGLSVLAGIGAVAATKGVAIGGIPVLGPLMNVPVLNTAATAVKAAATTAYGWTPWLSWLQFPLNFAAWATPGLAVGTATVGGLWTLGKIREGAERREFYKRNPTGRFQKKTFLQNVKGGAGLLFSPLKLFTAIPLGVGSAASWGAGKIGDGFAWAGKHSGTIAKGIGVGAIVGGTLAATAAVTGPGALIAGAGAAGLYAFLNRKGASDSAARSPADN